MFRDLAQTHRAFGHLLDQDILNRLTAYHGKFFSVTDQALPTDAQKKLQPRCADIEQRWEQLQKDIQTEMVTIENQMASLALEKKLTTRTHWLRRLRCNYDFYRDHRNITLEKEDIEALKFEIIRHLPQGYYPVSLLGMDHRVPEILIHLATYSNPFYVADIYQESLTLLNHLPDKAKQRTIARCLGKEDNQIGLNNVLPVGQFGFIMVWNLFNYFTEEVIQEWLEQINLLLRPGGRVFFSYNNCLDPDNAHFIDVQRNGFTIPSRLALMAQTIGLEIQEFNHIQTMHWAVLSKPGTFHSIRSTPGVGQIMIKN